MLCSIVAGATRRHRQVQAQGTGHQAQAQAQESAAVHWFLPA